MQRRGGGFVRDRAAPGWSQESRSCWAVAHPANQAESRAGGHPPQRTESTGIAREKGRDAGARCDPVHPTERRSRTAGVWRAPDRRKPRRDATLPLCDRMGAQPFLQRISVLRERWARFRCLCVAREPVAELCRVVRQQPRVHGFRLSSGRDADVASPRIPGPLGPCGSPRTCQV